MLQAQLLVMEEVVVEVAIKQSSFKDESAY